MKKLIALLSAFVMCVSVAGCNSDTETPEKETSTVASVETTVEVTEPEEVITAVNMSDTITTDFMEMTFDGFDVTERLLCPVNSRGDRIILGEVAEGKQVFYLSGTIKNIHTDSIGYVFSSNDCMWGKICFDGKYNYDLKMYIRNGEDMNGTLSPFSTGTYYLYAHVPNELLETYSTCTVTFGFCENLQSYDSDSATAFSFEECEYKYSVTVVG